MKRFLVFIAALSSLSVYAQDAVPEQKTKQGQKVLIGVSFSPDYNYRTLEGNSSSADVVVDGRNGSEIAKFGYTTGLNVLFNFSELFGFETGIQFSNKGYKTRNQDMVFDPPIEDKNGKLHVVYSYQYIGIPLKARFSLGKGKLRFTSSIGLTANFLVDAKTTRHLDYPDGEKEKTASSFKSDCNTIDISPFVSAGINYRLNKKFHLFAEPTFRYGVIKMVDAPITGHLWNAGLNLGFYYALK